MANGSIGWLRYSCWCGFYGTIGRIKYLKKIRIYSRFPLTNADKYIIMANMTNNNNNVSERFTTMKDLISTAVDMFAAFTTVTVGTMLMSFPIWGTIWLLSL